MTDWSVPRESFALIPIPYHNSSWSIGVISYVHLMSAPQAFVRTYWPADAKRGRRQLRGFGENSELESRPLTALALDVEYPAVDVEIIRAIRQGLLRSGDSKAGPNTIPGMSSGQFCHQRHGALARDVLSSQDAGEDIGFDSTHGHGASFCGFNAQKSIEVVLEEHSGLEFYQRLSSGLSPGSAREPDGKGHAVYEHRVVAFGRTMFDPDVEHPHRREAGIDLGYEFHPAPTIDAVSTQQALFDFRLYPDRWHLRPWTDLILR